LERGTRANGGAKWDLRRGREERGMGEGEKRSKVQKEQWEGGSPPAPNFEQSTYGTSVLAPFSCDGDWSESQTIYYLNHYSLPLHS
jgi:hypothetical protein